MSTMRERFEKTASFVNDDDVTILEGFAHIYLWYRFERAVLRRNRYAKQAQKYSKKLNENMDVVGLRKQMKDVGL